MFLLTDLERQEAGRFKQWTRDKLRGVRCPDHHQAPRLHFSGLSLRDVKISMSGCCDKLMGLANARIAATPDGAVEKSA